MRRVGLFLEPGNGAFADVLGDNAGGAVLEQVSNISLVYFGVGLDRERLVSVEKGCVPAKIVGADDDRIGRNLNDLVLMPGVEGQFLVAEFVFGGADGPAFLEFLDLAAERLSDDLMAETDADERDALP